MWLTPSSTARRSTAMASSWLRGGPNTPGPGSCIAPKPTRPTLNDPRGKRCTARRTSAVQRFIPGSSVGFAEHTVDLPASVVDDVEDALLLLRRGRVSRLEHRGGELAERGPQIDLVRVGALGDLFPWRRLRVGAGFPAFVGQLEKPLGAFRFGGDDQSLVDEQLQRRVDRAGAGPPQAVAALADLLDHLVAVHRPLGEQREDGRTDVTAPAPSAPPAAAAMAATRTAGTEAEATARTEAGSEAGTVAESPSSGLGHCLAPEMFA